LGHGRHPVARVIGGDGEPRFGARPGTTKATVFKGTYTGGALEVSARFITQARAQGVEFQYFGESCYQAYQGDPGSVSNTKLGWSKTLGALAERFPDLRFVAAEYGPLQREINDVVFALPGRRGAGSFVWEPTREGDWNRGHVLFSTSGLEHTATADLKLYEQMRIDYARAAAQP
jgi:hypothetical protein